MRHQVAGHKLNRTKGARIALRRTLIKQLFQHERITTTRAKAEAIRGEAERLITIARRSKNADDAGKVHARRLVMSRLGTPQMEGKNIVSQLFEEIAPRFENRNGGYTRMLKLGPRQGDAADMVLLELVEE
jgi:large subunit ribosomal protein L17